MRREFTASAGFQKSVMRTQLTYSAFVTFLTAGYPTKDSTVPLMLALEAGGADVIELGVPFSDPIADGPVIQKANTVSVKPTP